MAHRTGSGVRVPVSAPTRSGDWSAPAHPHLQCELGRLHEVPLLVTGDFNDGENSRVLRWLEKRSMINALAQFDYRTPTWKWRTSLARRHRERVHRDPAVKWR